MNRLIHFILTIVTALITIDVILMVINGTMILLISFFATLYFSFWLVFRRSPYCLIKRWIMLGSPQNKKETHNVYKKTNQINHTTTRQIF